MYRIALCEDEEAVRADLCARCRDILDGLWTEHQVFPFSSAEALEGALSAGERFDSLCLDILMAGKSGMALAQVEGLLPPGRFCRYHTSFLVNLEHVAQIGRREVLLDDGRAVPVSRSFCESAREQFVRFVRAKLDTSSFIWT